MNIILKILKLFGILIVSVSIILFSASLLLQDKIAGIFLKSLNKNISTKLDIRSFKLSFLRKFPKASLELKDVFVHSSSGFNSSEFGGINTDTLLSAQSVSVDFSIIDFLRGRYNIERISARDGRMNFFSDTSGDVNYNISVKSTDSSVNNFTINLERINLFDIRTVYNNLTASLVIDGQIKNIRIKSRISGNDIDFTSGGKIQFDSIRLFNYKISRPVAAEIDLIMQSSEKGILFRKGILRIEDYYFGLEGSVSAGKMFDLSIASHNFDIADIMNFLPEKYLRLVSKYNPSGILSVNSKIRGPLTRTSNPHIEINFLLDDGNISYGRSDLSINDLSFSGNFTNGSKNRSETSSFSITDLKATLGSAQFTGSFGISQFNSPKINLSFKGKVYPGELKDFFALQNISEASGYLDFDLKIENKFSLKENYDLSDFIDLKPEADLNFNSLTLGLQNNKTIFEQVNGNLLVSSSVRAKKFNFTYKGQRINIDGEFRNLPEWLSGRPVLLSAVADVSFNRFKPELFLKNSQLSDTSSKNRTAFILPRDLLLDINFKIDSLTYKTFSSTKISGSLNYKPRIITFKSFNMYSLNGMISGNGFIVQNNNKSYIAKGNFNVNKIDVNKTFRTFHNFGQGFLKAENIEGTLTGSLSLLLPMDSLLNGQIKAVIAEGKYLLVNGSLINFYPVKQLSSFIELSELENISFEQMENDFFIRNNLLYIPQMDINSSAVNLSVNGKHSFDNDYEYHVKLRLSEILSRKRKNIRSNVSEFGIIEDDGLGRTSILLKIEGKGEDVKVGYDIKATGNELKNNIKSERQTLKNILNQEYGWFKKDTAVKQKPVEKKSRFRITWDENDSIKRTPDLSKPGSNGKKK
jgi:hypothetical protein